MISVSVSGVRALGRRLDHAAAVLGRHGLSGHAGALCDGVGNELALALNSVENDWSKQRTGIVEYLRATGRAARAAADAYEHVEHELSRRAGAHPEGSNR